MALPPGLLPAVAGRVAAVAAVAGERRLGEGDGAHRRADPVRHGRTATPSMVMIDGQTVRGGRGGPTFHDKGGRGGRTNGAKRRSPCRSSRPGRTT